ncbi:BTAD domain-containing putative transcriptional regulator [Actinokineospora sp. 24-640]
MRRKHVVAVLDAEWFARLRLVVGPAGSGKSVLLRQLTAPGRDLPEHIAVTCQVGAEPFDSALVAAFRPVLDADDIDDLLGRLARDRREFTVYVDDAHRLADGPGAAVLARMLQDAPPTVRFTVATRDGRLPGTDALRGDVCHIGYDELRLRPWEVEELFEDVYQTPLGPEAAAELCARVEGLAVAVRLLHLETKALAPAERRAVLEAPPRHSRRLTEFLDREILGALPRATRDFMVDASPLGVLDTALCDAMVGRTDSAALLNDLVTRQALTFRTGSSSTFRFHVLLQQHLERTFAERRGSHLNRQAYHSAATYLVGGGRWAEAYRCYARAEDWSAAAGVLHRFGAHAEGLRASASVPDILFADDPWLTLAEARRLRGEGRLAEAYDCYLRAENGMSDPRPRWQCTLERSGIATWITDEVREADPLVDGVATYVAAAMRGEPSRLLGHAVPAASPEWTLGRAIGAVLGARADEAIALAEPLAMAPSSFVSLAGRLVVAVVEATMRRRGAAATFARLAADAEDAGWLWLARAARASVALLVPEACADAQAVADECARIGDDWGELIATLMLTIGLLRADAPPRDAARHGAALARRLGALVPEVWLRFMLVSELERRRHPDARGERAEVDRLAATMPRAALATIGELVAQLCVPTRAVRPQLTLAEPIPEPPVSVRCLGSYELAVDGKPVDLDSLRAQARRVLRVLSMHYGHPLHEERLVAALWPDAPLAPAKHRLQVAISSLRALLRGHSTEAGPLSIDRLGSAYLLRLPAGSTVDVVEFAEAVRQWRAARHVLDAVEVRTLGHRVLDLYRGELLSEEGPAEWVLARREATRGEAAGVAAALARYELDRGNAPAAAEICERALTIDELDNRLWTLLAEARHRCGNAAAAQRASYAYNALLAEG